MMKQTFKCGTCDHFNRGCIAPVPFWAEPHGRPRVYAEDTGCEVHSRLAELPADLAQAPAPVRVKVLEWSLADWNQSEGSEESALSSFGRYYVKSGASYWGPGVILSHGYHSLTGAKAAAQADYEARILAALEAPDAGVVAELVEALRGLFGLLDAGSLYEPQAYRAREVLAKLGGKANG